MEEREHTGPALFTKILNRVPLTEDEQQAAEERTREQERQDLLHRQRLHIGPLAADLGARYTLERVKLSKFEIYHAAQEAALERLRAIRAGWPESLQQGCGLIFLGPVGTGKDHLLAACLYEVVRHGQSARWVSAQSLFGRLRDAMDSNRPESELLNPYERADVLAISDPLPPVGELSAWNVDQLQRLVDSRYRNIRPTFIAMNAADEQDATVRLGAPLWDRLRHGAEVIACRWPSYRGRRPAGD